MMKITISDTCIACGLCVDTAPELFEMDDDLGRAVVKRDPQNPEEEARAKAAAENCPVGAIEAE